MGRGPHRANVMPMQDFKKLLVWRRAHELTLATYRAFEGVSRSSYTGLRGQALRAAASVPSNIAEGCGKRTRADFIRFLQIAHGSAQELEYHLLLARDLGLIDPEVHQRLERRTLEVRRMLHGLWTSIQTREREAQVVSDE